MKMRINKRAVLLPALLITTCMLLLAPQKVQAAAGKDSVKPYEMVITPQAITTKGFITVHKINNRYLFELPDSILGRDLFTVNRLVTSPEDYRHPFMICSYGNDWIGHSMFRFTKDEGDKLLLQVVSTTERSDSGDEGMQEAMMQNNLLPVYASFPIKAYGKDKKSVVVDLTDYFNSDNGVFGYLPDLRNMAMGGNYAPERSFITSVRAYPMNIEVGSTKSYQWQGNTLTAEYNSSIILLSKEPMKGRTFDERVGFFGLAWSEYKKLDANRGSIQPKANIWRFRLEPKPEDLDRYYRGELVEPAKPIVFYIDPETPKKWVPYLMAGVNDWQKAFEKAGCKNAVLAKEVPAGDTTFDMNDARHNMIVYKASSVGNAIGHSVQDPRSGEIIESHIQWFHSVMEILYKWYFIQTAAIDTGAQKPTFSDELMGELIRFVSSHEVGHALGLRHNWGSSSTTTVAQLRNKQWVEANGHTPSIMDYARFNYVAQPEDHIERAGIFPRIGDYDQWAIEWGYKMLPKEATADAAAEKKVLNQWIIDKLNKSDRYRFGIGDDPTAKYPNNQREDLGDDAMLAGTYGIKNLQRIKQYLVQWVQVPGDNYDRLGEMYNTLVAQYEWYIKHATANVGGVMFTPKTVEQPGAVYSSFSKEKQQRAIAFLNKELFATPGWLADDFIYHNTHTDFNAVEGLQRNAIKQLLDMNVFTKLRTQEIADPTGAYTVSDLLNELSAGIFAEWKTGKAITANRRFVQNAYVVELIALMKNQVNSCTDANRLVIQQARELLSLSKKAMPLYHDEMMLAHLQSLHQRLEDALRIGR